MRELIEQYRLRLRSQELPLDHPDSRYYFNTQSYVATRNALDAYGQAIIGGCLIYLQTQAKRYKGLDYLQVFEDIDGNRPPLWFIDDGNGGATTALLPEDY